MAAGFSEDVLRSAAGFYQIITPNVKGSGWPLISSPYGDDPNDQKWINEGIKDYKSSYGKWYGCSGSW